MRSLRSKAAAVLTLALLGTGTPAAAQEEDDAPRRLGLVEETGVTLLLLDVVAVDRKGRPLTGLTLSDFSVSLGLRSWKLYSVDDLCPCTEAGPEPAKGSPGSVGIVSRGTEARPEGEERPAKDAPAAVSIASGGGVPPRAEPLTFVLYLDFSELQMGGRGRALKNAERWIRETMQPGEEAMIVGYTSVTGFHRLCPPTSEKSRLLGTLQAAYADHSLIDTFPAEMQTRQEECENDPTFCPLYAQQEYLHSRSAMRALKRFMSALEEMPGRKAVLYFHENGAMNPGSFYGRKTRNHYQLSKEVGAAANEAHASLYTVNVGVLRSDAVTLGLNLSDFTGGGFNRYEADMARFLDGTERSCRCLYRLGLVPPERPDGRTHPVTVMAAGHALPHRYEVRFLSDADRWMRRALRVLENPREAAEISVTSALVPLRAHGRRWDLSLRIAVDTSSLTFLPAGGGLSGEWETGALFSREDGAKVRELLGTYRATQRGEGRGTVLHEHELEDLPAGTYRLRAFVRDRAAGLFGGTEATVTLPHPRRGGITGPIWMYGARDQQVASLSLVGRRGPPDPGITRRGKVAVPAGEDPRGGVEPLEAHTWFCRAKDPSGDPGLRFITRDARPLLRFGEPRPEPAGDCFEIVDRVAAAALPPGAYVYWLSLSGETEEQPLAAPFRIGPPSP